MKKGIDELNIVSIR